MGISREDISSMFDYGVKQGATHMLIVCDTYDWEDYPVFVSQGEDVRETYNKYNGNNMQKVMEVYNLSIDKEEQLNQYRVHNF